MEQLIDLHRLGDIAEPVPPEISRSEVFRESARGSRKNRVRNQRLTAVRQTQDPCRAEQGWAEEPGATTLGGTRIERRPDTQMPHLAPVGGGEVAGQLSYGEDRLDRVIEYGIGSVTHLLEHSAAVAADGVRDAGLMPGQDLGCPVREALRETRAPLDVGEQKRDLGGWGLAGLHQRSIRMDPPPSPAE